VLEGSTNRFAAAGETLDGCTWHVERPNLSRRFPAAILGNRASGPSADLPFDPSGRTFQLRTFPFSRGLDAHPSET